MAGLHTLKSTRIKPKARVGRGGKRGKTSGRGTKGQKARAGHRIRPEMRDFIKKLPKLRGFGKNRAKTVNSAKQPAVVVDLADLNVFDAKAEVTIDALLEKGIVTTRSGKVPPVKILANGTIEKALTIVGIPVSAQAKALIEKAGGSVK